MRVRSETMTRSFAAPCVRFLVALGAGIALLLATPTTNAPGAAATENGLLAFQSDRPDGINAAADVFTMNDDGSAQTQITFGGGNEPAWNANGTKIAFSTNGNYGDPRACLRNLFVVNPDGTGVTWILGGEGCSSGATTSCSFSNFPSWSPDGTKIVYAGDDCFVGGGRVRGGIFVVELATRTRTRLTTNQEGLALDADPSWSHDGTKIAFSRADPSGFHIHVMDVDGGNLTQLESLGGFAPAWSPDDSKIAFSSARDGNWEIWVMDADGSNPVQLTNTVGTNQQPSWSPDGTRIVFESNRDPSPNGTSDYEIWAMNADGTSQTQLTSNSFDEHYPDWQPSGEPPPPPPSADVVVTDCDDPALATLTTVEGDLIIGNVPDCDDISLPNLTEVGGSVNVAGNASTGSLDLGSLTTVTGSLTIEDNASTGSLDLGSLTTVTGSLTIEDNASVGSLDLGSLTTVGGSVNVAGNASIGSLDLGSLTTVTGSLTIEDNGDAGVVPPTDATITGSLSLESTGTGNLDLGSTDVTGTLSLEGTGYDEVSGTTADGATTVQNARGDATMRVHLPDGTFEEPVAFTITRSEPETLPPQEGTGSGGEDATIDPLSAYQFDFDVPTLNADATLTFDIHVDGLDTATRDALLAALDSGTVTLAARGDAADATYQAFPVCAGAQVPTADGCALIERLDADGNPTTGTPATVRFSNVVGHFSTWAVAIVEPSDTTPPVIAPHTDVSAEATGPGGAQVAYTLPTATDDVDGPVTLSCSPAPGSLFPLGHTTVHCSAEDAAGNEATSSFDVIVEDTTPPTIAVPADIAVDATGPDGAVVSFDATATDLVDGTTPANCDPASGSLFPIGNTTITCTATDGTGNTATGSFTVHVRAAAEQIAALIAKTEAFVDDARVEAVLRAGLLAASRALAANRKPLACATMNAYIAAVRLLPTRILSAPRKSQLIADAVRIRTVIGC